jgi:hypothetical protein
VENIGIAQPSSLDLRRNNKAQLEATSDDFAGSH